MPSRQSLRRRREQLEVMPAGGQARLERAGSRSLVVDTMLVSLFLFARLAVAELNATLWERRHPSG